MTQVINGRYLSNKHGFLSPEEVPVFNYSDGEDQEKGLEDLVRNAKDRSTLSPEMLRAGSDWVTRYHFNPRRANLLRPVAHLLRGAHVLEFGAGCGAITRFLGETAKRVVAVEGSPVRSRIAAMRCQGLDNVVVVNDTIQKFQWPQKFDVVTLIGVLEYARLYDKDSISPERNLLRIAKEYLKPGGHLLLAIENQLGIKYFAGAVEDHVGKPYFGLHDLYTNESVVTFGRVEMEDLLTASGFSTLNQMVPLPDYKLPVTVLHPACFEPQEPNVNIAQLIKQSFSHDSQTPAYPSLSLEAVTEPLVRNKLVRDLSNSLFYIASTASDAAPLDKDILVSHYGLHRYREFMKETKFIRKDGSVHVVSEYLAPGANGCKNNLTSTLGALPYMYHRLHSEELIPIVNRPGWTVEHVAEWAQPWLEFLKQQSQECATQPEMLPSHFIDCIPTNCFLGEGQILPFDMEWSMADTPFIPLAFVAFRGLFTTLFCLTSVAPPHETVPINVIALTLSVLGAKGIDVSGEGVLNYLQHCNAFSLEAMGERVSIQAQANCYLRVRLLA